MNTQSRTTFSEILVTEPLILRLNWCDNSDGIFLQSLDMLWTEMLWPSAVEPDALEDEERTHEYQTSTNLSSYAEQIQTGLQHYIAGHAVDWHDVCAGIPLPWDTMPPFRKRVLQTLYQQVGHGQTVTYGQLATLAGSPKAARAVGSAMSANPWPLIVP